MSGLMESGCSPSGFPFARAHCLRNVLLLVVALLLLGGCASTRGLHAFTTDGCSLFPDGDAEDRARWSDCCVAHDQAYWRGGTAAERKQADRDLRACVLARTARPMLAGLMYRGVRVGGMPLVPTPFRWAYGWTYGRGYAPLTPEEQRQADEKLAAYYSLERPRARCTRDSE